MTQSIDIITALPTTLSCIILLDWLKLKSVITLDTAYCSNAHRESFAALLQSEGFCIREKVLLRNEKQGRSLKVLPKFGEKLRHVALHDSLTFEQLKSVLTHCRHLSRLHLVCLSTCTPNVWDILRANCNLERLEISLYARGSSSETVPSFERLILPKLRFLKLYGRPLESQHFIDAIKLSQQLVCLDFAGCPNVSAVFRRIPKLCPGLKGLGLATLDITNEILNELTASCPSIVHLNIASNFQITDDGLTSLVRNLPSLQSLCMQDVPLLTEDSLTHIQTHCAKTLHTLYLGCGAEYGGQIFARAAINEFMEHCTQLRTFSWQQPNRCIDSVFSLSVAAVANLSTLFLCGLDLYSMDLTALAQYAQNLTTLVIKYTPFDDLASGEKLHKMFESISIGCPRLRELYILRLHGDLPEPVVKTLQDRAPNLAVHLFYPYHLNYILIDMPLQK